MTTRVLPNFIIAGVNKAGTTSVFQYLKAHPQVCCSRDKETGFFFPARYGEPPQPLEIYEEQFLDYKNEKIIMEATPGYFYGGFPLAETIKKTVSKDCKILILLREPVSRLVSFYRAKKKSLELNSKVDFKMYMDQCLNMPEHEVKLRENNKYTGVFCGYYNRFIDDWFRVFGDDLKIVFYDDLKNNPKLFMDDLCKWIELDPGFFNTYNFEVENKTYAYKNRVIQKMAITVNNEAARFWRQNPKIKKWIRRQYFKINSTKKEDAPDKDALNKAAALYSASNSELKHYLLNKGIKNLPGWLNNEIK